MRTTILLMLLLAGPLSLAATGPAQCGVLVSEYSVADHMITFRLSWENQLDLIAAEVVPFAEMDPFDLQMFTRATTPSFSRTTSYSYPPTMPPQKISVNTNDRTKRVLARGNAPETRVFTVESDPSGEGSAILYVQGLSEPGKVITQRIPRYPAENIADPTFIHRIAIDLNSSPERQWSDATFAVADAGFENKQVVQGIFPETISEFRARNAPRFYEGFPSNTEADTFAATTLTEIDSVIRLAVSEPLKKAQGLIEAKSPSAQFRLWARKTPIASILMEVHCPPHATHLYLWSEERWKR